MTVKLLAASWMISQGYRFIEDAEVKAAILEVLIDLGRQLGELGTPNYH